MIRPHTWMRWRDSHHGARTTVSLWTWAKLKSWLWTSGRDSSGPTPLLWSVGPLWRGWVASSKSVCTSPRTWHGLHTFRLRLRKPGKDCTICDSWGNSGSHQQSWKLSAIESVLTQCISVWYGNSSNQDCKALQRVVRLAERISGSALPSLQDIYLKRCKSRAAKILKDSTHPGNHLFCLLPSGKRFRSMMAKTERLRRSFFHKPSFINLYKTHYYHHPYYCFVYIPGTNRLHIPLARPSCSYYYLLSPSILFLHILFVLHFLFYCTFYSLFLFFYLYICSCVVLLLYNFNFYSFALSTERTWFDLHFTSDYTLYNLLCDE